MEYLTQSCGYNLYKNSDGFIEGFKSTGKKIVNGAELATGMGHVVTNCTTVAEFEQLIAGNKTSIKPKFPEPPSLFP